MFTVVFIHVNYSVQQFVTGYYCHSQCTDVMQLLIVCSFIQLIYSRTYQCSADVKLVFILQQGRNLGADAASAAVHSILDIINQSLGKTSTRQGQQAVQQSGQSQTVDQEMARFQFCSHDNEKQQHCIILNMYLQHILAL